MDEDEKPVEDGSKEPVEGGDGSGVEPAVDDSAARLQALEAELAERRKAEAELQAKLAEAKTPEEFTAARSEWDERVSELEREVERQKIIREEHVPDELTEFVKGDSVDEMLAAAKKLVSAVGVPTPDPTRRPGGGMDSSVTITDDLPTDPAKLAARVPRDVAY